MVKLRALKSGWPKMGATSGVSRSATAAWTSAAKAAPITNATARSMTLPRSRNCLNSVAQVRMLAASLCAAAVPPRARMVTATGRIGAMRPRFALLGLAASLAVAAAACAGDPPSGQGAGGPATTAVTPATAASTAPPATVEAAPETTRRAPKGVVAVGHRKPAPPLRVTDFQGRPHDLAELRGRPVV